MSFKGFVKYPNSANLNSWFNQNSSSWTKLGNSYNLWVPSSGSTSLTGRYVTPPSTPYTVIAHVCTNPTDTTGQINSGLGFGDGTKVIYIKRLAQANFWTSWWFVEYYSAFNGDSGSLAGYNYSQGYPWIMNGWMAIRNDGTNIYFFIGDETGHNFYQIASEAKGNHLGTITQVGIYSDSQNSIEDIIVDSWQVLGV